MHRPQQNLFTRDDTFFGICQGYGEDLHIPPNLLRLTFAVSFFFSMQAALTIYFAAGLILALVHWIVPDPVRQAHRVAPITGRGAPRSASEEPVIEELARAA